MFGAHTSNLRSLDRPAAQKAYAYHNIDEKNDREGDVALARG